MSDEVASILLTSEMQNFPFLELFVSVFPVYKEQLAHYALQCNLHTSWPCSQIIFTTQVSSRGNSAISLIKKVSMNKA